MSIYYISVIFLEKSNYSVNVDHQGITVVPKLQKREVYSKRVEKMKDKISRNVTFDESFVKK